MWVAIEFYFFVRWGVLFFLKGWHLAGSVGLLSFAVCLSCQKSCFKVRPLDGSTVALGFPVTRKYTHLSSPSQKY